MRLSNHSATQLVLTLWITLAVILGVTTFFVPSDPYASPWFTALWTLQGLVLTAVMIATKMWRRLPSMTLHSALLLILIGGGLTAFGGARGEIFLAPGAPAVDTWIVKTTEGIETRRLPESLSLDSFVVARHEGLSAPRDFTSYLSIGTERRKATVSVNHPLTIGSYRFYQSSYDPSGASILGVNYDPGRGMAISYAAYILLGLGFILCLANPRGRFRHLLRAAALLALIISASDASAAPRGISLEEASALDTLQVLYQGRVAPFSTPATDLLLTLADRRSLGGQSATRVAASIIAYPADWGEVPLIYVKSRELRSRLGMTSDLIAPDALYAPDGTYRLAELYTGTDRGLDRDIIDVDGRLAAFRQAAEGELVSPLPGGMRRLTVGEVRAEQFYTAVAMPSIAFMAGLTIAILALLVAFIPALRRGRRVIIVLLAALALWEIAAMVLKWMISGSIPMSSGGDALALTALILTLAALILWLRRAMTIGAMAALMAGFAALVAKLATPAGPISPVMPVLASPWLAIHVSLIMTAYALLALTFAIALVLIFRPTERLRNAILATLYPALALLAAGIFTGAVWAGEAWGRYWAWDPKETWALITLMVYAIPLHINLRPRALAAVVLAAFLTVVMTYWGVNLLPSLHAYQ